MSLENTLKTQLQTIFAMEKTTFNQPSDSHEQNILFVEIENVKGSPSPGKFRAEVRGKCSIYSQLEDLPLGYVSKQIAQNPIPCKPFFFYAFEENTKIYMNIVLRSFSFVYFYEEEYDSEVGEITEVDLDIEMGG